MSRDEPIDVLCDRRTLADVLAMRCVWELTDNRCPHFGPPPPAEDADEKEWDEFWEGLCYSRADLSSDVHVYLMCDFDSGEVQSQGAFSVRHPDKSTTTVRMFSICDDDCEPLRMQPGGVKLGNALAMANIASIKPLVAPLDDETYIMRQVADAFTGSSEKNRVAVMSRSEMFGLNVDITQVLFVRPIKVREDGQESFTRLEIFNNRVALCGLKDAHLMLMRDNNPFLIEGWALLLAMQSRTEKNFESLKSPDA